MRVMNRGVCVAYHKYMLIILHKHNSPATCYRTCMPILYPPNHGMFICVIIL